MAEKKKPAAKPAAKKAAPASKPAAKKAEPAKKAAPAKKAEPAKKAAPAPEKKKNNSSYHVSKRAEDGKWQVFRAGSTKVIKLFDTKAEAEEYSRKMAENQGVAVLTHASKGKNKGRIQ